MCIKTNSYDLHDLVYISYLVFAASGGGGVSFTYTLFRFEFSFLSMIQIGMDWREG